MVNDDWQCGFCREPIWKFRRGRFRYYHGMLLIAWHVQDAHQVEPILLEDTRQIGKTFVLPDGRVWLCRGGLCPKMTQFS